VVRRTERKTPPWSSRNKGVYITLEQRNLPVLLFGTSKSLKYQNVFMYRRVHGICSSSTDDLLENVSRLGARRDTRDGERLARTDLEKTSPIVLATVWFPSLAMPVAECAAEFRSENVIASPIRPGFGTKRFSSVSRLEETRIRTS
jgi:hypothetical protein